MNQKDIKSEDGIEIIDGSGKRLRIREGKLQVKLPGDTWRLGELIADASEGDGIGA